MKLQFNKLTNKCYPSDGATVFLLDNHGCAHSGLIEYLCGNVSLLPTNCSHKTLLGTMIKGKFVAGRDFELAIFADVQNER